MGQIELNCQVNCMKWNSFCTVSLNWIDWNRNVFDNQTVYSCCTELFEIELIICIKIDLALNSLKRLICHKTRSINQPYRNTLQIKFCYRNSLKIKLEVISECQTCITHTHTPTVTYMYIYMYIYVCVCVCVCVYVRVCIYIYIYIRGDFNKFQDFLYRHLKLS